MFFFLLPILVFGKNEQEMTASQIVDASLNFCGGEQRISKIESSEINYLLIFSDQKTATINEKRKEGEKYVQCVLSKTHMPQTTFFNSEKVSIVNGKSIRHFTDLKSKEEIKLKTYHLIQYGYKQLKYQLTRLPDKKFEVFDCFVVQAQAENGYTTINFFDKTNFRLLMVAYPSGNKSLMIDYLFKDGVLFNSHIQNTFPNTEEKQIFRLWNVTLNPRIEDIWFNCPYSDTLVIPKHIRTGKFISTNRADTRFTRTEVSMDYTNEEGNIILRRFLLWMNVLSSDLFGLINEEALKNNDRSSNSEILVRIISWDENGYVCQWITETNTDTQDYKLIK
jgi:hypothetical protein